MVDAVKELLFVQESYQAGQVVAPLLDFYVLKFRQPT